MIRSTARPVPERIRPRRRASALLSAILVLCALAGEAIAGPDRVLVLPLDGDADAAVRTRFSASVQRLARLLGGKIAAGDATFTDTATAIGCDPKVPACAEDVRATLGVDELVYGTITKQGGELELVVWRTAKGKPRRQVSATLQTSDSPERVEPAILPLFQDQKRNGAEGPTGGPITGATIKGPPATPTPETPSTPLRRDRMLGIAAVAGGGTILLISLSLWASASGLQSDISDHPVQSFSDFQRLKEIEDTASARAWTGNAMFVVGLAVGGLGGWLLYRDHKAQRALIAPAPMADGAGITITWTGGLP